MVDQTKALPEAPAGGVEYTDEQLAAMEALPSRPCLQDAFEGLPRYTESDPCPSHGKRCRNAVNPKYDPRMDPNSERWAAHEYFTRQEQQEVYVHVDPEAPELEVFGMSINGFTLPCYPGKRQRMPRDFVDLLKQRNQRLDVHETGLVSKDENQEGALTLAVGGGRPRPFVRRVAD
jgi:rRNA maturation protein Nop10